MSPLHDACRAGDTEVVKQLLDDGAPVHEKDEYGYTALMRASEYGHTEVVQLLLDKGASVDEKNERGKTALMAASVYGHTEVVQLLLDKGASADEKTKRGNTALFLASGRGHTEVVQLLLDKGASVDEKDKEGSTALMDASNRSHTKVVRLLLDKGASVDEKNERGSTALTDASGMGHTEVVQLLLDKGASVDEKNEQGGRTALMLASLRGHTEVVKLLLDNRASLDEKDKFGDTALMWASENGHTEVVQLLFDNGALFNAVDARGDGALLGLAGVDEDHLGRMAAAQAHRHLPQRSGENDVPASEVLATAEATATAVLSLVRLAGSAAARARKLRSGDPRSADDHQALFGRLQLAAAACILNDESGKARGVKDVQELFRSVDGRKALEHAVEIEAKELLAQPVVQKYIEVAWRGEFVNLGWAWVLALLVLLLQLIFVLPLVALVPPLGSLLRNLGEDTDMFAFVPFFRFRYRLSYYLLHLPIVKFGLECAADLTLALVLTFIPAADLAKAPFAPLLLVWVGSGLLWEARQVMAPSSSGAESRLARGYDRLAAYWGDSINRVDATALIFSAAALVAFMSAGDSEDATATSLHAVAVFLLWLRVIRVLLVSPQFGPFVLMFFRMLFGDVIYFLVLLLFLLVAFAASWSVLLAPQSSIDGCAGELGGVDFHTTLLRIFEGALTGNDYFECARNSTNSPVAAWGVTAVYVTLTAVLLLNMLIAMMAKTFDNISEASATNYLFLFAQRTLAHQNEPPTPPPLNVVGLPCEAMCLLWAWLHPEKAPEVAEAASQAAEADPVEAAAEGEGDEAAKPPSPSKVHVEKKLHWNASGGGGTDGDVSGDVGGGGGVSDAEAGEAASAAESAEANAAGEVTVTAAAETAGAAELKAAAVTAAADNARLSAGSVSSEETTQGEGTPAVETSGEEAAAVKAVAVDTVAVEAAVEAAVGAGGEKEKTFAEKIAPLAEKITEYILDHQDDAAQEDRWRTTMKRAMVKSFRVQREEVKAEAQKIETEMKSMQQRFDEVHSKMDEKMDQLVRNIADLVKQH